VDKARPGRSAAGPSIRDTNQSGDVVSGRAFLSKPIPSQAKSSKAGASPSKENQRKSLGFPWILFAESGLFNGLYRPLGRKFFFFSFPRYQSSQPLGVVFWRAGPWHHDFRFFARKTQRWRMSWFSRSPGGQGRSPPRGVPLDGFSETRSTRPTSTVARVRDHTLTTLMVKNQGPTSVCVA
jgi:hypothetical protein